MSHHRLNHHIFASCTAEALHLLPDSRSFTAERGERCIRLHACWSELLADCAELGTVAIVSQSAGAQFARCIPGLDFAPVPDCTEIVELGSGFVADTAAWSHVLAVEEPAPGGYRFSLQFFAQDGEGLWKLMLTRDAQLDHFAAMVRHYASGNLPPVPAKDRPATTSRLIELQAQGRARAYEVPHDALTTLLLAARREERALTVSVDRDGLQFCGSLVPRTLERCSCAFHAYDHRSELHLDTGEGFAVWWVRSRHGWALEILDAAGQLAARLS